VHIAAIDAGRAQEIGLFVPLLEVPVGYYDALLQGYAFDGVQYGIPWNTSLPALYANADLLAEAGIAELPATFAAFTEACERLNTGCATWPIDAWVIQNWTGGTALDSPTFINFATWWAEMSANGHYVSNRRLADWDDALTRFLNGEAAFLVASTADEQAIRQRASFAVQSGPLPDATGGFIPQGGSLWMTAGHLPAEQAAAQTLLTWLTNTENGVRWHKGTGFLPTRPLAYNILTEQDWQQTHPALSIAQDMLNSQAYVATANTRETNQILEEGLLRIIGGVSVESEVATMQDRIAQVTGE